VNADYSVNLNGEFVPSGESTPEVPLPAAAWMLLAGVGAVAGLGARGRARG